jgi:L,D-transpeptidase YcbB
LTVLLAALVIWAGPAVAAASPPADPAALETVLRAGGALVRDGHALDRSLLQSLYRKRGFAPMWNAAREASFSHALDAAPAQGLDAARYRVTADDPVARELLLTDSFLRYAAALAKGRVSPRDFETDWLIPAPSFDPAAVIDAAINGDVARVLADLAPHEPAYLRLSAALQHYRDLSRALWPAVRLSKTLHPGESSAAVPPLRVRLAAEGFLDRSATDDSTLYDARLADAVARFQAARGLGPDRVIGRQTLAALDVSAAARVQQIQLNLERWRSLPRIDAPRRLEVNAAAATVAFYDEGRLVKVLPVIVGAVKHPTPVLQARIDAVLFNPPWNVPSSIYRKEILPLLKRDPGYLDRLGFYYPSGPGAAPLVQRPGPKNALGDLKFEMPNPADVYMHDTPNRNLFALPRRTLSHGCVRVGDPRELAKLLLDSPEWPRQAIDEAIATGQTDRVKLARFVPVYLLYWTAFVDPDGTVEFRDDIYGRDRRVAEALAAQNLAGDPMPGANRANAC